MTAPVSVLAGKPLRPRELEVLALAARGRSNDEISRELFVSLPTTKTHMQRALAKLGARDRTQAVAIAYERGLLPSGAVAALGVLRASRSLLAAIPQCPWHPGALRVGPCADCERWLTAQGVLAQVDALLAGGDRA